YMKTNKLYISIDRIRGLIPIILLCLFSEVYAQDGKALFKQNCGVCHTTTKQKLVGPGLEGINTTRTEEWLIKWIKDSQGMVKSGDATAIEVYEAGGKMVMPPFAQLSDGDIKAILSFVGNPDAGAPVAAAQNVAVEQPVKSAPWSTGTKVFITLLLTLIIGLSAYLMVLKYNLRRLGYSFDTLPLSDRVSKYLEQNGRFLMFVGVIVLAMIMKSCISSLI
ncbi:MAG TPA: cytochrome c, partial [Bacteroidia bacterium]|nr:cytochrome c [Bacteroidia bacterium]